MPKTNSSDWYKGEIHLILDRLTLLTIVASLELTLRHPQLPPSTREAQLKIGKALVTRLIDDGLLVPPEERKIWEKTFGRPMEAGSSSVTDKNNYVNLPG